MNWADYTLHGDDLERWKEWTSSLQQRERLLRLAILVNRIAVVMSTPLCILARVVGIPLTILDMLTMRLITLPIRLASGSVVILVLSSSASWERTPATRPVLLIVGPCVVVLSMILTSLYPREPDVRNAWYMLCELWPLTGRRIRWIQQQEPGDMWCLDCGTRIRIPEPHDPHRKYRCGKCESVFGNIPGTNWTGDSQTMSTDMAETTGEMPPAQHVPLEPGS